MQHLTATAAIASLRSRGETAPLEAKSAVGGLPKSLLPTLSAFANGDGGTVLLGIDEQSGFTPAPGFDARRTATLLDEAATCDLSPPLRLDISIEDVEEAQVVMARVHEIPADAKPCHLVSRGERAGSYIRSHEGDRLLTDYETRALRENRDQPRHDAEPTEAEPADLDTEAVAALLRRARRRQPRIFGEAPDDVVLRQLNVLVPADAKFVPSLAGLLALGRYPQQFHPQLHVSFIAVPGEVKGAGAAGAPRFLDSQTLTGPLPVVIEDAVTAVLRNSARAAHVHGVGREDRLDYPIEVVREAIVNAVMHRDLGPFGRGTQVQVELYSDRLDVLSPGGLFGPVTNEDLGTISSSRNSRLALLLSDVELPGTGRVICENRGSGISVMREVMRREGRQEPEFHASLTRFRTTLRRGTARRALPVPGTPARNRRFQQLLDALSDGKDHHAEDLARDLGLQRTMVSRYLRQLIETGEVEATAPPRDRRRRYRIAS